MSRSPRHGVDSRSRIWLTGSSLLARTVITSRREFLGRTALAAAALAATPAVTTASEASGKASISEKVSLCGAWRFQLDPHGAGTNDRWYEKDYSGTGWHEVSVPHTWQLTHSDYRGTAWYRRAFDALPAWRDFAVRLEFEAVFHSAAVWVNGEKAGEHARKGYTAFAFDITSMVQWGGPNVIAVRVDNAFNERMLPRGGSSDWANDGGIFRPVQLLITPKTFVERVYVEAMPNLSSREAAITLTAHCRNTGATSWSGKAGYRIVDEDTGLTVGEDLAASLLTVEAGKTEVVKLECTLSDVKLWHFDFPHLYRAAFLITDRRQSHQYETTFGVRKFEIKEGRFHLNGEAVRLMGVERMAGSNPEFGMAEPAEWTEHDHRDLKDLNCVFSRVHWPQDRRVLDYCDRFGILMQSEVPAWGYETFTGMGTHPDSEIMENGLEQLREMIDRDRNHPCVVAWGLCNEIDGQNPAAYEFAKTMLEEAKRLDPGRLCSYASNSLLTNPERDVAGLMDFVETNEYFGTWAQGDTGDLDKHFDKLHQTFPEKPVVVSEYGYCACTPDRPEGDAHRIEILRKHNQVIRSKAFVGGAIFFCYNDYRTHAGDRGMEALRQRVHGVVDVYGAHKPSYAALREESSPIAALAIQNRLNAFRLTVRVRNTVPSYTLRSYKVRGRFFGQGDIPVEVQEADLPELPAGANAEVELTFAQPGTPLRMLFEVIRPTGFAAWSLQWEP